MSKKSSKSGAFGYNEAAIGGSGNVIAKKAIKPSQFKGYKCLKTEHFKTKKGGIGGDGDSGHMVPKHKITTGNPHKSHNSGNGKPAVSHRAGYAVGQSGMKTSHGQHGGSKDNNMNRTTGGYMIGKGTRTFKPSSYRLAGPAEQSPGHSQPSGHKKLAGPL